ncbi:MAG: flagellar biosynthesis protein FlhA [Alphaproteobacteria bacterium]|nr:flagellar biosynthesis protein FlhA [Alphaproteobacteria bacterium]
MSDSATSPAPALTAGGLLTSLRIATMRGDIGFALGIIAILAVLILPLPSWLLDFALTFSITFSVLILMTALFIEKPLDFSAFPVVLLIATMLRLSLNLASTRLILAEGHSGTEAAGQVIQAFGNLVMEGNFIIGIIVFAILMIVNFVVITKGSGRIAEVAARFSLDAMPGKQMAIDADLSAGLIDESAAKIRRKQLEDESSFFGAMDGAAKFVRGDAIAGLMITFINIIGGIIIGVAQKGLSLTEAGASYTILSVGDGLVTQIPALIVSTAAGLLVSKAGVTGAADKALVSQLSGYPQALGLSSFLLGLMGLLPGMPFLPFLVLSAGSGWLAWYIAKNKREVLSTLAAEQVKAAQVPFTEEPIQTALAIDDLRLELGYGLLPLINEQSNHPLTDQIRALRRQIASEMGFVMPSVRILDNIQLPANGYVIRVKEVEAGSGELKLGHLLVMDPRGMAIDLPGIETREPTFNMPAMWIDESLREEASFRGYTVVDPPTVITTHLTETVQQNMRELLSYGELRKLLDDLPTPHQKLLDDISPAQITLSGIQRILQTLLAERVSIRDLPTILEGISEAVGFSQNIGAITEHVRARLARQICHQNIGPNGYVQLISMSPEWEQIFAESIVGQGDDRQLAMPPSRLQEFIGAVRLKFDQAAESGQTPALLCSPFIRPFVRSIVERFRSQTAVLSQNEIHPQAKIRTIGQI